MEGWKLPIGASIFIITSVIVWLSLLELPRPEPTPAPIETLLEERRTVRDVTPGDIVQPPQLPSEIVERLPAKEVPPPPPKPPEPVGWTQPSVLAAGIIKSRGKIIHLGGITPVGLDQSCFNEDGSSWPCGRFARTDMQRFVRGRRIDCDPVPDMESDVLETRCRLSGYDMSAWLVLTGWAEPEGDLFAAELDEAKTKRRGKWR